VKKNRRTVHANTMTFLGPPGSYTNHHYTYTVCIGSGSFNSISAEKKLSPELHSLTSKVHHFYSGSHKRIVLVLLFPRSSIQDRPKRCYSTNILSYKNPLTRRWGWLSNFQYPKLVSCASCHWRRLEILDNPTVSPTTPTQCNDCGDFDYTMVPPISWNLATDTYPVICCECGECPTVPSGRPVPQQGPLPPRPQSLSWILDCIRYAIQHRNRAIWSNVQTLAYLKQCGINDKTAEHIDNIMIKEVSAQDVFVPDEEILDRVSLPSWSQNFPYMIT
jgi:hypothetical protein